MVRAGQVERGEGSTDDRASGADHAACRWRNTMHAITDLVDEARWQRGKDAAAQHHRHIQLRQAEPPDRCDGEHHDLIGLVFEDLDRTAVAGLCGGDNDRGQLV